MLLVPDIDYFGLGLATYSDRHNIQTRQYHLPIMVSAIPTNGLFALPKCLLLGNPFNQLTSYVIDLDRDISWLVQDKRDSGVGTKGVNFRREDPWLAGQRIRLQIG